DAAHPFVVAVASSMLGYYCRRAASSARGCDLPAAEREIEPAVRDACIKADVASYRFEEMVPRVGFEPTAYRLRSGCSTAELPGRRDQRVCSRFERGRQAVWRADRPR